MSAALQLVLALLLVFLNGFFVAAEYALVKVRLTRLSELANEGRASARMALHELHHFDVYLSATQLGVTLASLALGAVSEPAVGEVLRPVFDHFRTPEQWRHVLAFLAALGTVSVFHMVVGELVPKTWAIQRAESLALGISYPLHAFYWVFRPAIYVINAFARVVLRMLRLSPSPSHELAHTEEELRMILTASGESGVLKDSEVDLVKQVFEFADRVARDVMVPRVDMVYLDVTWPLERNMEVARSHTFTRFPLCEGDPDHVIAMIHVKDLVRLEGAREADLRQIGREIIFVPESKPLDQLLREFQLRKSHMAAVVDEYGGTAGIVTLEDVLEEIVGEIHDEFEEPVPDVQVIGPDEFLVDGKALLDDLNADHHLQIPPNESDTIGGWILDQVGAIPEEGDTIETDGLTFHVEEVDGQRVRKVRILRQPPVPAPEPEREPAA